MNKKTKVDVFLLVLLAVDVAVIVLCLLPDVSFSVDETANGLWKETLPRLAVGALLVYLTATSPQRFLFRFSAKSFLWSLPCLCVALANFPFSALLSGSATLQRTDLLWLFLLDCFAVSLFEETFFRALLQPYVAQKLQGKRNGVFLTVLVTAALFALSHLLNLIGGAGVAETLLQVGYTFLLGCMFSVTLSETGSLWPCFVTHALFDVGGLLVPTLGRGEFQDTVFWIVTAAVGVLCGVYVLLHLLKRNRLHNQALSA